MTNFLANLPHMVMATVVTAAAVVLSSTHVITGGEAIALIGAAGGFSLGTAASNGSLSPVTAQTAAGSASNGSTQTTPATATLAAVEQAATGAPPA